MTIKTQLQTNNAELQAHLQDILALPNVDDVKNGQYVWKKYEIDKSTEILNPKFTADFVPSRDPNLKITNKNFGMPTEATYIDFFDGFKDSSGRVFTKDGNRLKTPWGYVYRYYESQNAMHISTTRGPEQPTEFTFTGTKQITTNEQMKNYIGYVVSDNESAYPDGGEKDGFWYERVVEGVAGVDFGEVTASSRNSIVIEHSLGVIPSQVYLLRTKYKDKYATIGEFLLDTQMGLIEQHKGYYTYASTSGIYIYELEDSKVVKSDSDVTFNVPNSMYPYAGTYKWVFIA